MRDRTIRLRWLIFSTLILVGFSGSSVESLAAQVGDQPGAPVQSPVPDPSPIPANDISARTASVRGLVRKAEAMVESDDLLTEIQEAFPAEQQRFDGLREQTGTFLLAPGYRAKFAGNFSTINGMIVASQFQFSGNAAGTVRGNILNLSDSSFMLTGNAHLTIDKAHASDCPAGLERKYSLVCVTGSYRE